MKKILIGLFAIVMCFVITGCGPENLFEGDIGDIINGNDGSETDGSDDIKLYSDSNKLVYNYYDTYTIVYYRSGDTITGLEYYYNYQDSATAAYAVATMKANLEGDTTVESVKQNGKYIIVKYNSSVYEGYTAAMVEEAYSYLEQVEE